MRQKFLYFLVISFSIPFIFGCGKTKTNFIAKTYHNTTSIFNWYYNGERVFQEGVREVGGSLIIPTDDFIPLLYTGDDQTGTSFPQFDEAIELAEVILYKHPLSKWIDNSLFLIGRSWFYKGEYYLANETFKMILDKYPDSKLIPEVYLWILKTHYMNNRPDEVEKLMEEKMSKMKRDPAVRGELALFKAEMQMKTEDYNGARKTLEKNIKYIPGKDNKARVYYLLGQINREKRKFSSALTNFTKVTKINTNYEIIVNAKIQRVLLSVDKLKARSDVSKIKKELKKLVKDDKNENYRDRLYYELAKIDLLRNKTESALDNLKNSIAASTVNERQKALSYFKAGQIFFSEEKNFTMAQAYFDSAAVSIDKKAPEYQEITMVAKTLKEYVKNSNIIQYQDSMLSLSKLSDGAIARQIDVIIGLEKEKQNQAAQANKAPNSRLFNQMNTQNRNGPKISGFYFSSQEAISNGRLTFQNKWGNRKFEDNWRRSNKEFLFDEVEKDPTEGVDSALVEKYGDKAKYYTDIPKTEDEKVVAETKIRNALFDLGQIFELKLLLPDSAVNTFNKLIQRFPQSHEALKSHYSLYKLYKTSNPSKAEDEKKYICNNNSNSIYCKLINNQDIQEELNAEKEEFNSAYNALYTTYSEGDYETSINFSNFVLSQFYDYAGDNLPNVYYIKGLCYGELGQKDSLRHFLTHVKRNFPGSEVTPFAIRTLELMDGISPSASKANSAKNKNTFGNNNANPSAENLNPDDSRFKGFVTERKERESIFVVMLIDNGNIKTNELKILIKDFNTNKFPSTRLTNSTFRYKSSQHLVYISQFQTESLALAYISATKEDPDVAAIFKSKSDRAVFITPTNFKTAYGSKRFEDYLLFYEAVILPSLNE